MKALLSVLFVLWTGISSAQDSTILWNENVVLNWSDFLARPPEVSEVSAMTAVTLNIGMSNEGQVLFVIIEPKFNRYESWSKENERSPLLLKHEQLHFDIHELNARRFRAALKAQKVNMKNISIVINKIMQEQAQYNREEQERYDRETDHSLNKEKQEKWNVYVARELRKLDAHRDSHFSLKISD